MWMVDVLWLGVAWAVSTKVFIAVLHVLRKSQKWCILFYTTLNFCKSKASSNPRLKTFANQNQKLVLTPVQKNQIGPLISVSHYINHSKKNFQHGVDLFIHV